MTKHNQQPTAEAVKVGDQLIVTIKRIGINGEGVGYYRRKAVFIPRAITDEVVKIKVTQVQPSYMSGEIVQIQKKSPFRQQPACAIYEQCGGCQLQHMSPSAQLRAKEEIVREAFSRYAQITDLPLRPILGMEEPWGYRNKAQLQAGMQQGRLLTGLYSPGTHQLVDISGCPVQHPKINQVISKLKSIVERLRIPIYNERKKQGCIRTFVVRVGFETTDIQVTLITATHRLPHTEALVQAIRKQLPEVTTLAQNINDQNTSLIFGEKTIILWGKPHMQEQLGDIKFALSPRAFFQLNPQQTMKLYQTVSEAAALTGRELVLDLYCGTGTIALWLASQSKEVRGIESIPEAIADAKHNAELNGMDNAQFYVGKAEQLLPKWVRSGLRPDVIVVDPPRTGCDRRLLQAILEAKPKRFIYVSCNPSTLAKDMKILLDGGYAMEWVQPVDMFPQTSHVECCVLLVRK